MQRQQTPRVQRSVSWILVVIFLLILAGSALSLIGSRYTAGPVYGLMEDFYSIDGFIDAFDSCEKDSYDFRWNSDFDAATVDDYAVRLHEDLRRMGDFLAQMSADVTINDLEVYQDARALNNLLPHYMDFIRRFSSDMENGQRSAAIAEYYAKEAVSSFIRSYSFSILRNAVQGGQARYFSAQKVATLLWVGQLLLGLGTLAVAAFFAHKLSDIIRPVGSLIEASEALQKQEFDLPDVESDTHDPEVRRLVGSFNRMKQNTLQLVTTLKEHNATLELLHKTEAKYLESQRLAEQARLSSLRNQIRPHFLFNTLNTIRRMAQVEHAPQTESLIFSLARILRYSLRDVDRLVPLADEIAVTKEYLQIQNTRFGDRITLSWDVDETCEPELVLVPQFILQPLVENAVRHGLEPKPEGGHIRIHIYPQGDMLCLVVADDGCGMAPETLRDVRQGEVPAGAEHGIGLRNVYRRLRLLDDRNELTVRSELGQGTEITVRIPIQRAEDQEAE